MINGIDQIQFTGIAHTQNTIDNGAPPVVGTTGTTKGLLTGTSYLHNGGVIINNGGLNGAGGYEMTFTFDITNTTIFAAGPNSNFTHIGGAALGSTGLLNIYIDKFGNGGVQSDQSTGNGYSDGVLVAQFMVDAGLGGVFNAFTFNGSDDARSITSRASPNVILEDPAVSTSGIVRCSPLLRRSLTLITTDGTPDVVCPTSGIIGSGAFSRSNFCAQEDGRASSNRFRNQPPWLSLV